MTTPMYTLGYTGFTRDTRTGLGGRSPYAKTGQDFESMFEFRDGEVPFSMFPLGYFGHDASAALVRDGEIVACAAEERFTRAKFSLNLAGNTLLPRNAIRSCLQTAGISLADVDVVAHYCQFTTESVTTRFELLRQCLAPDEARQVRDSYDAIFRTMMSRDAVLAQFERITGSVPKDFLPVKHHLAHASSAYYTSGFRDALILTIDGTGETESALLAVGHGKDIIPLRSCSLPTSLGALYLILTVYLGFKSLGDEYKVMGLASYGDPARYRGVFDALVTLNGDGTYATPMLATRALKEFLLARLGPARGKNDRFDQRHADVAAALQDALQSAVLHTLADARRETGLTDLCLAGGVALNCTLNGVIARSGLFKRLFIQPAASDEGCSVGAAMYAYAQQEGGNSPIHSGWTHAYWGPSFGESEVKAALESMSDAVSWKKNQDITGTIAAHIAQGKVAGWFQGRMEFGPRALGNRSILGDARDAGMKDRINEKVKRRESFRPFAPAVLEEDAGEYFDMSGLDGSPFMLFAVPVYPDKQAMIPAVTHVDGSARVQTVSHATNPRFWKLIKRFKDMTGVPVVLNTSFNVKNEPIVCTPSDAIRCFLSTDIDCVAIEDYFVLKRGGR